MDLDTEERGAGGRLVVKKRTTTSTHVIESVKKKTEVASLQRLSLWKLKQQGGLCREVLIHNCIKILEAQGREQKVEKRLKYDQDGRPESRKKQRRKPESYLPIIVEGLVLIPCK